MLNQGFQWHMPIISVKKRVSGFIDNLIITEGKSVREKECTCGHILNHHKIMKQTGSAYLPKIKNKKYEHGEGC